MGTDVELIHKLELSFDIIQIISTKSITLTSLSRGVNQNLIDTHTQELSPKHIKIHQ